jgi:hypothetical protein
MRILSALISGACRSLKSWKGVLIIWFITLLLVTLIASPVKNVMQHGLGRSMVTEQLADGFDFDIMSDLNATMGGLSSYLTTGFFLVLLTGFLINIFLSGGLFNSLRSSENKFSAAEFFRSAGRYFWSFLFISLIIYAIILFLMFLIVGITVIIAGESGDFSEAAPYKVSIITGSVFLLFLMILLLVADYARAWQVAREKSACFSAIGFGFSQTFKRFWSSFPLMIIVILMQVLFGWLVLKIIPGWRPGNAGGVIFLFLSSQFLFFLKIILKTWRYGSVTALMEKNNPPFIPEKQTNLIPNL